MSLCAGGGTKKKSIHWCQADILATLNVADKRKILLFEFIFFDIKIRPSPAPSLFVRTGPAPALGYEQAITI
jgi:hypothetical protein